MSHECRDSILICIGTCNGACQPGGFALNGDCFYSVTTTQKKQAEAEQYCINTYGGHLTSIHSAAEWDFLYNMRNNAGKLYVMYTHYIFTFYLPLL